MIIRKMKEEDLEEVNKIYNEEIRTSTATFNIKEWTNGDQKRWFEEHNKNYPIFVITENQKVVGWSSLSKWSDREAYKRTAELSIYLSKSARGKKLGTQLLNYIIDKAKKLPLHTLISLITSENEISIKIHEKFGFKNVGTMKEVGEKFGKLLDVVIYQKIL